MVGLILQSVYTVRAGRLPNFEHLGDLGRNDPWHGKVFKTRQRKDEVEFFIGRKVGR
jgi:hypothetical protein